MNGIMAHHLPEEVCVIIISLPPKNFSPSLLASSSSSSAPSRTRALGDQNGTERFKNTSAADRPATKQAEECFLHHNLEGKGPGNKVLMVMHRHQRTRQLIQGIFYARGIDWVDGDSSRCVELKGPDFGRGGD